jgi:FixJ family two-component response regulator
MALKKMPEDILISIIDDDASVREAIRALVQSLGHKAVTFSSAGLFLQSEVMAKTTCLITDLQMSGLNGLELQEELRSRGYRTPVIVITAYSDEKRRTLAAGAAGFLSKPFDAESLIECLNTAIKLRSS